MYPESPSTTSSGHPELIAKIADEIHATGPLTFARFMEMALYDPWFGYYMRREQGDAQIGWNGDYYTSSDLHPTFGRALATQLRQIDDLLGHPDPFSVVEMGPGKGLLARDILEACADQGDSFAKRLSYVMVERSPAMKALQRRALAPWLPSRHAISWAEGIHTLGTGSVEGVLLSNELVDALPVHRVRVENGELREVYVDMHEGRFCEQLKPLSTPALAQYLDKVGVALSEGQTAEINLEAVAWIREVARVLRKGLVITIDYGHTAQDLYSWDRRRGTLLCYYRHNASEDPYSRVGLQDMTSHVDFTTVALTGEEAGLHVTGFTNHLSFLTGLGIEETLQQLDPESAAFRSIVDLLDPRGMGQTFKILIQHKCMARPDLDGLKFQPFFRSALTTGSVKP